MNHQNDDRGEWIACDACAKRDRSVCDACAEQGKQLAPLHARTVKAGDDRLNGIISREDHAQIIRQTMTDLDRLGLTWEMLVAFDSRRTA